MMNQLGKVLGTFSAKKGQSGLPRPQVEQLELIYQYGIKEDKFAGCDEEKAVMVVGKVAYEIALNHGMHLEPGSLGENILFDFNPHDYPVGAVLKVGNTLLEITQHCTICNHLAVFGKELPKLVKDCRGLYCKILEGGEVEVDMLVEHIKEVPSKPEIA